MLAAEFWRFEYGEAEADLPKGLHSVYVMMAGGLPFSLYCSSTRQSDLRQNMVPPHAHASSSPSCAEVASGRHVHSQSEQSRRGTSA